MRRIGLAVVLALGFTLMPLAAEAQQARKVYRLGWISQSTSAAAPPESRGIGLSALRAGAS